MKSSSAVALATLRVNGHHTGPLGAAVSTRADSAPVLTQGFSAGAPQPPGSRVSM